MARVYQLSRRTLLEGIGATGLLLATGSLFVACDEGVPVETLSLNGNVNVYRFQTTKSDRCNACKSHQHYKVFTTSAIASANRAHVGCNCRVVQQQITPASWDVISPYVISGAVDLRAVYPI